MIEIDVIDGVPGLVHTAELAAMLPAWQTYVDQMVGPAWGLDPVKLHFAENVKEADPAHWWIVANGHSDESGALGYHAVQPNGLPYSRVFAADDARYGVDLSVTMTHELAEMLVDPKTVRDIRIGSRIYTVEVCDAVEDDRFAIDINGVKCSDFVLPAYFDPNDAGPWDYKRILLGACPTLAAGGYIGFLENGSWHQTFARLENGSQSYRSRRYGRVAQRAAISP